MQNEIQRVALSIRFKEYLLSRDLESRRVILNTLIALTETSGDTMKHQILMWLQNIASINNNIDNKERREQIRMDAFWGELHYELSKSVFMHSAMQWFVL